MLPNMINFAVTTTLPLPSAFSIYAEDLNTIVVKFDHVLHLNTDAELNILMDGWKSSEILRNHHQHK